MLDIKDFLKETPEVLKKSIFDLGISPEYNIGEVTLASLYRRVGWQRKGDKSSRYSEDSVNTESTKFFNKIKKGKSKSESLIHIDDWTNCLQNILASPKMAKQVKSPNPILYPLVPDCALYSNASRLRTGSWNPGRLVEKIIVMGQNPEGSEMLWKKLFNTLAADSNDESEDIWARILANEFSLWRENDEVVWKINDFEFDNASFESELIATSPTKRFCDDLSKVLDLKSSLSRRHWLSLLESLLRIGTASHTLWVCSFNSVLYSEIQEALKGRVKGHDELKNAFDTMSKDIWHLDEKAGPVIKKRIESYIRAKVGIHLIIQMLGPEILDQIDLNSYSGIKDFLELVKKETESGGLDVVQFNSDYLEIVESDIKQVSCRKGRSANLFEFIRYSLGQKQTADPKKRNYDQSYWIRKSGNYNAAPWVVNLGPTSLLLMVYCCSYGYEQNRTISDLIKHLRDYGLVINESELEDSNFLSSLTTLQVIGDSPDAEGGMIILNPFGNIN